MKNVLMVAYYFPPMGGSGVQRPLKFAKYLPDYGWKPHVLTPDSGSYRSFDATLTKELEESETEVIRVGADTPFHKYDSLTRKLANQSEKVQKLIRWLAAFVYFPDNKKGWIKPAVEKGLEYVDNNQIDVIYATGPPFSNYIIAQKIKEQTGIPVVLDYRDDMLGGYLVTATTPWHRRKLKKWEHYILEQVEAATAINHTMLKGIQERFEDIDGTIFQVIEQGYDSADFENIEINSPWTNDQLHFLYSGIFYEDRQPDVFLKAMSDVLKEKPEMKDKVKLHFQGILTSRHKKLIKELGLENNIEYHGYLTHKEAVSNLKKADVLWLITNFGKHTHQITTGKLFEYLGALKPVIGLVDTNGEAARLLRQTNSGYVANPEDRNAIKNIIISILNGWMNNSWPKPDKELVEYYDRKKLTGKLAQLLERMLD